MLTLLALAVLAAAPASPSASSAGSPVEAALIEFREIIADRAGKPELAPRIRELAGQRVRIRGWLVVFEEAPGDGFWLAPRPVFQDESGANSGELPPASVRVTAPASVLAALPDDSRPLEVVGRLTVARQADEAGRVSVIGIQVDEISGVRRLERRPPVTHPEAAGTPALGSTAAQSKEEHR